MFCCVGMEAGGPSDTGGSSGARVLVMSVGGSVNRVVRRRVLRYQRRVREPYRLYSPFSQMNRSCECRHTYGYPMRLLWLWMTSVVAYVRQLTLLGYSWRRPEEWAMDRPCACVTSRRGYELRRSGCILLVVSLRRSTTTTSLCRGR